MIKRWKADAMDIRVLRYFIAAVEAGSISGACSRVHVTQPTLSRQFMDLEEELGHKLFERSNRRLLLTPKGKLFYERALLITALFDRTKAEMKAEEELAGDIRIAAGETPCLRPLARAIARLREEAPLVSVVIVSGHEEIVRSELHSGVTDFGVFIGDVDLSQYGRISLKERNRWGLLTRRDGELAGKTSVHPEDLLRGPLVASLQASQNNELLSWLGKHAQEIRVAAHFNLLYNAYLLAEAGVGNVLALEGIINPEPKSNLVWLPLEPELSAGVSVAWVKDHVMTPAAERLLALLREEDAA